MSVPTITITLERQDTYLPPLETYTRPPKGDLGALHQVSMKLSSSLMRESRLANDFYMTIVESFDRAIGDLEGITIVDMSTAISPMDFSEVIYLRFRRIPNPNTRLEFMRRLHQLLQGRP